MVSFIELNEKNLMELPEIAPTITYLTCNGNYLTILPDLPPLLTGLECRFNKITRIPSLPPTIWNIDARHNLLTELPQLPQGIKRLDCVSNKLTCLPALPSSLISLACADNRLTELPELPPGLTFLSCIGNPIKHIPVLPRMLKTMYVDSPHTIPSIPNNLEFMVIRSMAKLDAPSFKNIIDHLPRLPGVQFTTNPYRGYILDEILKCVKNGFCISVLKYMYDCPYFDKTLVTNLMVKTHTICANLRQLPVNQDMIVHIQSFVFSFL